MKAMKFNFIGLGAAGNKAVLKLVNEGVASLDEVIIVNSTDKDFPKDYEGKKVVLNKENTGCGKERPVAKEYMIQTAQSGAITTDLFTEDCDNILLITSVEGGTGSGATPFLAKYLNEVHGLNVHICAFTGFEDDIRGLQNTIEFFQEISKQDIDIMTIRNAAFLTEASNNKFKAEELANEELVKRVAVMIGKNIQNSSQNIDDTDMFKTICTSGYKTIEEIRFNDNISDIGAFDKLCETMIKNSKSVESEKPGQLRMAIIMNIRNESEGAIDYSFNVLKEYYGFPYETFLHKQYDGKGQYIQIICSGMKLPLAAIQNIYDRYSEETNKVDKENDTFASAMSSMVINSIDKSFDMVRSRSGVKEASEFFNDL